MNIMSRLYSLHASRGILKQAYRGYKKKRGSLSPEELTILEQDLEKLDKALLEHNREEADALARKVELFNDQHFKKSLFEYASELVFALILALIIATLVRQVWFEPYEIPTGSMRPTFEEQDHVTVTKTAFGINYPLETRHIYFDPALVQRTSIFIFSGDKIPTLDSYTKYFGIIPYKKRYIKRCMGKPGDSLYFYGGKIYGIDKEGKLIEELLDSPWLNGLEHIPFLRFEGDLALGSSKNEFLFKQMNLPIGRLLLSPFGETVGEVFNGKEWVKDQPLAQKSPHQTIQTYSDFWGIRNFAMARLLTKEELKTLTDIDTTGLDEGLLYLELRHTPSLSYPKPTFPKDSYGGHTIKINPYTTIIPLKQEHLDALIENMYTARFIVKDGRATRYSQEGAKFTSNSPHFPQVPDGTYEFYYGKARQIGWGAISYEVPADSPLYQATPENVQKLYNMGIEMDTAFSPRLSQQILTPHRYAYFREGDLYLLGAPVFKKTDPLLIAFNEREQNKEKQASVHRPYIAFKDYGPPLKDGKIDISFIKTFGLTIPEKEYLALGDNHAMSSDSRVFGTVPEANLQGAPCYIIWPPGSRWGAPPQKPYPIFNFPRLVIWGLAALIGLIWYSIHLYNIRRPIFKKLN